MVKTKTMYGKKCDKCNEERYIEFISPLGNKLKERCDCCDNKVIAYFPTSYLCIEFKVDSQNGNKLRMWYKKNTYDREEYYSSSSHYEKSYTNEDYNTLKIYDIFFDTIEECQKYCDWLNRDIDLSQYSENL